MENFLSIYEFSKLSGIESSALRYWDEIGLFSPVKRNPENNYRYYAPEQIIAVNFIKVLSSLNVPLKTIGEIADKRSPESIVRLIEQQEKLLDMEMRRLRECYSIIHARREMTNYGSKVMEGFTLVDGVRIDGEAPDGQGVKVDLNKVAVMYREDSNIILGPRNKWVKGEGFYGPFTNFCKQAEALRINLNFPIGGLHDSLEDFVKASGEPQYFFSVDPTGNNKRKSGNYVVGFDRGYYGELGDLPERMMSFVKNNSLTASGPVYVTYLHDEVCIKDPSEYLVQACVAVSNS